MRDHDLPGSAIPSGAALPASDEAEPPNRAARRARGRARPDAARADTARALRDGKVHGASYGPAAYPRRYVARRTG